MGCVTIPSTNKSDVKKLTDFCFQLLVVVLTFTRLHSHRQKSPAIPRIRIQTFFPSL